MKLGRAFRRLASEQRCAQSLAEMRRRRVLGWTLSARNLPLVRVQGQERAKRSFDRFCLRQRLQSCSPSKRTSHTVSHDSRELRLSLLDDMAAVEAAEAKPKPQGKDSIKATKHKSHSKSRAESKKRRKALVRLRASMS